MTDAEILAELDPLSDDPGRKAEAVAVLKTCETQSEIDNVCVRLYLPPRTVDKLPPDPPFDWSAVWGEVLAVGQRLGKALLKNIVIDAGPAAGGMGL